MVTTEAELARAEAAWTRVSTFSSGSLGRLGCYPEASCSIPRAVITWDTPGPRPTARPPCPPGPLPPGPLAGARAPAGGADAVVAR